MEIVDDNWLQDISAGSQDPSVDASISLQQTSEKMSADDNTASANTRSFHESETSDCCSPDNNSRGAGRPKKSTSIETQLKSLQQKYRRLEADHMQLKERIKDVDPSERLLQLVDDIGFMHSTVHGQEQLSVGAATCLADMVSTCGVSVEKVLVSLA